MRPVRLSPLKVMAAHCSVHAKVKAICLQGHCQLYNPMLLKSNCSLVSFMNKAHVIKAHTVLSFIVWQKAQLHKATYTNTCYLLLFLGVIASTASNESFLKRIQPKWMPFKYQGIFLMPLTIVTKKTNFSSSVSHIMESSSNNYLTFC